LASVSVRAPTGPSKSSILRMVPSATLDFLESSLCAHPRRARAARICLPLMVTNEEPYHDAGCRLNNWMYFVKYLIFLINSWDDLIMMRPTLATARLNAAKLLKIALSPLLYLTLSPTGASAQTKPPAGVPAVIFECDHGVYVSCGTWTWDNGHYDDYAINGAVATLTVQSFTAESVIINRTDTSQSVSYGLTGVYTGQISSQGNSIVNGSVTWTWPGHNGFPFKGTWTGSWGAPEQFTISTVAGDGKTGYSGDNGPATSASFNQPKAVALDSTGNLYIADQINARIRKVALDGTVTTIAGNGVAGYSGDGGPAISAQLYVPTSVFVDAMGDLLISDQFNQVVRMVAPDGIITTVAGNGVQAYCGDGGPAVDACMDSPLDAVADAAGNIFIADFTNNRVRKVSKGIITTVAGNGNGGYSGDGGPATSASVWSPQSIALNAAGDLFIADIGNHRIRKVSNGIITTVVGTGVAGYSGDGGPGTSAEVYAPRGTRFDASGNLYFSDWTNNVVRVLLTNGTIFTVAGNFSGKYSGDGGPATIAGINTTGVAVAPSGAVYVSDNNDQRIRLLTPVLQTPAISTGGVVSASDYGKFAATSPGSQIEIYGSNLAGSTRGWYGADFNGVNAPTSLDGTSVTIGGKDAFVDYISPLQVNVVVPSDVPTGLQPLTVKTAGGTSAASEVTVNALEPGLLAPPSFDINGTQYVVAFLADGAFALPVGAMPGATSRPAKPGDIVTLYGIGFGQVVPDIPAGQLVKQSNTLASDFRMLIGGLPATAEYSGLAPNYTGLYQFNIVVPNVAASDAVPLTFTVGGVSGTQTLYIAVQN
jgi:uncharacterized protein (TIGR03437 family)